MSTFRRWVRRALAVLVVGTLALTGTVAVAISSDAALGWLAWPAQDPKPKPTAALRCRTVVFVRHAEKDPDVAGLV